MKAFTAASLLHYFILQLLSKLWDLLCELCICLHIYMLKFTWYLSLGGQDSSPPQISNQIILFVWLCDRLSASLTTFATSSPFFSLHSLQQLNSSYYIRNGSSNRASHSLQLSLVEGRHGGTAPHQEALQTHRRNRGSASIKSWQRKILK